MYVMAPEPILTAYFINPSHQSVHLYVYSSIFARQGLGKYCNDLKSGYRWGMDWRTDLLTACICHPELQVIMKLLLISTLQITPHCLLTLLSLVVAW
jgi:hypothetical protein